MNLVGFRVIFNYHKEDHRLPTDEARKKVILRIYGLKSLETRSVPRHRFMVTGDTPYIQTGILKSYSMSGRYFLFLFFMQPEGLQVTAGLFFNPAVTCQLG